MKKESNYISMSESRKIRKYNIKQMRYYEKQKRRKCSEDEYITTMHDENNVVEIENLETCFFTDNGTVTSVHGVSFDIPKNKIVGVVGESGCGKSVTSLSIMQLVQAPQGQIVGGSIRFNTDQLGYDENGNKLAYDIVKMPTAATYKVRGKDVTIQAQILELLRDLQKREGCSIMLITHDLGVIAEMADEVVVMYAGRIIEKGTVQEIFHNPMHPYTIGLQKSKPLVTSDSNEPLYSIPGQVPNPINLPDHCYFRNRCERCIDKCKGKYPEFIKVSDTHYVSCYLYEKEGD